MGLGIYLLSILLHRSQVAGPALPHPHIRASSPAKPTFRISSTVLPRIDARPALLPQGQVLPQVVKGKWGGKYLSLIHDRACFLMLISSGPAQLQLLQCTDLLSRVLQLVRNRLISPPLMSPGPSLLQCLGEGLSQFCTVLRPQHVPG